MILARRDLTAAIGTALRAAVPGRLSWAGIRWRARFTFTASAARLPGRFRVFSSGGNFHAGYPRRNCLAPHTQAADLRFYFRRGNSDRRCLPQNIPPARVSRGRSRADLRAFANMQVVFLSKQASFPTEQVGNWLKTSFRGFVFPRPAN